MTDKMMICGRTSKCKLIAPDRSGVCPLGSECKERQWQIESYLNSATANTLLNLLVDHDRLTTKQERGLHLEKTNTKLAQTEAELVDWLTRWVPLDVLQQAVEAHPTQHFDEVYRAEAAAMQLCGQIEN